MLRIAVMVSGGGTNLQALLDAKKRGEIPSGEFSLVIASNEKAYALQRAADNGIPSCVIGKKMFADTTAFEDALLAKLKEEEIDLIVLAGYLSILGERVVKAYPERIINIHPALIPSFCGAGFYGLKVHEAALEKGVKVTGATVHFVNEIPDGGRILAQKAVDVLPGDTPEKLQRRVMEEAEWLLLPRVTEQVCAAITAQKMKGVN